MSVRTMARVWASSTQSGTHLLMLLAIADFADDDGNAYPAVPTLAAKCRMQPRNANVILAALRKSGELEVRPNEGPRGTNLYRVVLHTEGMQDLAGVQRHAGVQRLAAPPAKACPKPLQAIADEPSMNHHEPSGSSSRPGADRKPAKARAVKRAKPVSVEPSVLVAAGFDAATAAEFIAYKADRKAPLTDRAWNDHLREAAKAGWTPVQAAEKVMAREWRGFEARYVADAAPATGATASQRRQVLNSDDFWETVR